MVDAIVIETDGAGDAVSDLVPVGTGLMPYPKRRSLRVPEQGLVGLGGAAFPTSVKLTPPPARRSTHIS
jgi:electron transport complex protein RnfC